MIMAQINAPETTDEVIRETRRIKESLAQAMDFDIDRILEEARKKERQSERKILTPPAKVSTQS